MRKIIRNILAVLIILFSIFGVVLQTETLRERVRSELAAFLEKQTGCHVEIDGITITPTLQISIDRLEITDGIEKIASVHGMRVSIFPLSLEGDTFYLYSLMAEKIESGEIAFGIENGSAALNSKEGSIHLQTSNGGGQLSLRFSSGTDRSTHINDLHISLENLFSLEGQFSFDAKGNILDSTLFLTTEELSDRLKIAGYLYGEGKVLGSIWTPEIAFHLFGDELKFGDTVVRNVQAELTSHQTPDGLQGQVTLSLTKETVPYTFKGDLSWDEPLSPLPTRLTSEISLEMLKELLDIESTPFSGKLSLLFSRENRTFSSEIRLREGTFENYELGQTITQIEALLEGNSDTWTLKEIRASDGYQGHFSGGGKLSLSRKERFPFELNLTLDKVQVLHFDGLQAAVSGPIQIKGSLEGTTITGQLYANEASFQIPEHRKGDIDDLCVVYVNQNPNEAVPVLIDFEKNNIPLTFSLTVDIPNTGKIFDSSLNSNWGGKLSIAGRPKNLAVTGELNSVRGTYKLRGRQLQINRGTIHFGGDLDKQISIYVVGALRADRYTIEVIVKGSTEDPQITFRSNPPLSRRETLSWLLFNKDLKEISEFQNDRLDRSIFSLSKTAHDGPDPLTRLGDSIGIDRIDITGNQEDRGVSFELGKYVSENTYISISRKSRRTGDPERVKDANYEDDHQDPSNRIGIETYLNRYFKLQAEIDEDQTGQINIIWKRDY